MLVLGPTGYIGRTVTKELIARGYKARRTTDSRRAPSLTPLQVVAFSREKSGIGGKKTKEETEAEFSGAHRVAFGDVKARRTAVPPAQAAAHPLRRA